MAKHHINVSVGATTKQHQHQQGASRPALTRASSSGEHASYRTRGLDPPSMDSETVVTLLQTARTRRNASTPAS
eukprot:1310993-Rhodomonas_salina.1